METKHGKHGGNTFLWGLILGALLATLLTTKRGRQIIRELINLGLELIEDFAEERTSRSNSDKDEIALENIEEVTEDLRSEITEVEQPIEPKVETKNQPEAGPPLAGNGNGHKKRLFKGIRRK